MVNFLKSECSFGTSLFWELPTIHSEVKFYGEYAKIKISDKRYFIIR